MTTAPEYPHLRPDQLMSYQRDDEETARRRELHELAKKEWADQTREERIRTLLWSSWPPSSYDWQEAAALTSGPRGKQSRAKPRKARAS